MTTRIERMKHDMARYQDAIRKRDLDEQRRLSADWADIKYLIGALESATARAEKAEQHLMLYRGNRGA